MKVYDILLTDADYLIADDLGSDEIPQYTESEIAEALGRKKLTAEMCVQMHNQQRSWTVQVRCQERQG